MLIKVVLPAPLLPINPTTASCSTATLMSLAAVTAPKLLFSPLASRTIVMSGGLALAGEQRPQPAGQEHDHHQHGDAAPSARCSENIHRQSCGSSRILMRR